MPGPTQHFRNLGAPLKNARWSWGAQRADGTVILRAWDDEIEVKDGKRHIRLTNRRVYDGGPHPGYRERLRHIDAIRRGADGYVVVCHAKDRTPGNRRLQSFDDRTLMPIASIRERAGDHWAELGEGIPAKQLPS